MNIGNEQSHLYITHSITRKKTKQTARDIISDRDERVEKEKLHYPPERAAQVCTIKIYL